MNTPTLLFLTTFLFLLGACIGSFLNVVIWRLPHRGTPYTFAGKTAELTLSWPPSHCPKCQQAIPFYLNLPVLAWLFLRGRCAQCHSPIAVRYPLVELGTGVLFAGLFLAYACGGWVSASPLPVGGNMGGGAMGGGLPFGFPTNMEFSDFVQSWPILFLHLFMVSCLLAAAAIDADWFIIPLEIPKLLTLVTLLAVPFIPSTLLPTLDPHGPWALPTLGGILGWGVACLLLWKKLIPQSFAQEQAEQLTPHAIEKPESSSPKSSTAKDEQGGNQIDHTHPGELPPPPGMGRNWPSLVTALLLLAGTASTWGWSTAHWASLFTIIAGILLFLLGVLPREADAQDVTDEVMDEISTPHARWEVSKELCFIIFPVAGAVIAHWLPLSLPVMSGAVHDGVSRLLGSLLGLLVGAGIVWFTRIFGTLGFGREAMGLGDVHLMYAVGAVLGAPASVVVFLVIAPVLGLLWALIQRAFRKTQILPYGPWLVVGAILALLLATPIVNWYLAFLRP